MPGLEYIVRPFQQQQVSLPALIEDESTLADPVVVHLTHLGGGVSFPWSNSLSDSSTGSKFTEVSRQTKTVKIENPDDPNQFVDVERAQEITVGEQTNPQNKVSWKFNSPSE